MLYNHGTLLVFKYNPEGKRKRNRRTKRKRKRKTKRKEKEYHWLNSIKALVLPLQPFWNRMKHYLNYFKTPHLSFFLPLVFCVGAIVAFCSCGCVRCLAASDWCSLYDFPPGTSQKRPEQLCSNSIKPHHTAKLLYRAFPLILQCQSAPFPIILLTHTYQRPKKGNSARTEDIITQ